MSVAKVIVPTWFTLAHSPESSSGFAPERGSDFDPERVSGRDTNTSEPSRSTADVSHTLVMGILNVTPDSFSDGGHFAAAEAAIAHGVSLVAAGADIVDIGGESTRPGAKRVSSGEELARVIPVITALTQRGIACSIDTMRSEVAQAAVDAGALIVNDVSGGLADENMAQTVAAARIHGLQPLYIAMHWRAHSPQMDAQDQYEDVAAEVYEELHTRVLALQHAGISAERLIVDPGLGFSKVGANNWPLLQHIERIQQLGYPVLIGASRKRFLAQMPSDAPQDRDPATAAVTAIVATRGAWAVRVHDVKSSVAAVWVARQMQAHGNPQLPIGAHGDA